MGSGAMKYVPIFIKIGSGIQKLMVWYTDRELGELYFYIFKIRKQV
jgi:hypothetical protein